MADLNATVQVTVDGASYAATNNGDGTWTLADGTIAALPEGKYDVAVVAADPDTGTDAYDSTADELTIDLTAPSAAVSFLTTGDKTPALSGTVTDPAARILVTVGGRGYLATNNGNGTWSVPDNTIPLLNGAPAMLDYGVYNVTVTATDDAGNAGNDATTNELTIQPTLSVTANALLTNDPTPELTGTVSDPVALIKITVNGATYDATNNGDGSWTLADGSMAALKEGSYVIRALATNAVFGTFDYDDTSELSVDLTAPSVTISPLTTADKTPALSGTINDPTARLIVTVGGNEYLATVNGGTWNVPDNAIPLFHGAPVNMAYGTYDVAVTATDDAGNVGTDATANELVVQPTLTVTVNTLLTNDTTPELTGTVDDLNAEVELTVNGVTYAAVNNADGTWTLPGGDIAVPLEPESPNKTATYDVVAVATDPDSGATAQDATLDELTIDLAEPKVTVTPLATEDTTPPLQGTVDDPQARIVVTAGGEDYLATNNGNGTWTVPDNAIPVFHGAPVKLGYGTYDVVVTATNKAGNAGTDKTRSELTVRTVPQVSVDELRTNDTTPELTGRVDNPADTVIVTVNGNTYPAVNNGDGTWTLPDNTVAQLTNGAHDVVATATNAQGNSASDTTTDELVVDTVPPQATLKSADGVDLADTAGTVTTSDTTPGFAGTLDDSNPAAAGIVVTVGGQDYDAEFTGYQTNDEDEQEAWWELKDDVITALAAGTYDVTITVSDEAGNGTARTWTGALRITDIPTVAVDRLTTDDRTPALSGTVGSTDAIVVVTVNGQAYGAVNYGDGTWRVLDDTVASLGTGTYDIAVTATNANGTGTDGTAGELTIVEKRTVTILPLITSHASPALTGTVNDPDAIVEIRVDGHIYKAKNNEDGTWTLKAGSLSPLGTGTYDVIVRATHKDGAYTFDETSDELVVVDETLTTITVTLVGKKNNGGKTRGGSISYEDTDGTNVTVLLNGRQGSATLTFVSDSPINRTGDVLTATAGVELSLMVVDTDTDRISFRAGGGADGGTTIGFIGGDVVLNKLQAQNCDLIDNGINMASGIIEQISLRSIQTTDVMMGGTSAKGVRVQVRNNTEQANIRLTMASVKSFTTGSMIDSSLLVGTLGPEDSNGDGVSDLPRLIDLFGGFGIGSVKITGYKGAEGDLYVNANVAASRIGKIALMNAILENRDADTEEPVPFGVTAENIGKLTLSQGNITYTWPGTWLAAPGDLEIRVAD